MCGKPLRDGLVRAEYPIMNSKIFRKHRGLAIAFVSLAIFAPRSVPAEDASAAPVDFNRDVRPILSEHCTACHGGVKRARRLSFV